MMKRLSAILFMDVVGYSKRMSLDESGTLAKIKSFTDNILNPAITKHNGKLIKSLGDGWLVAFASCHDAVSCSNTLKQSISSNPLDIRFGINSGDVHFENNDVFGDTVNIAARLEAISSSNEITVSESVYQSLEKEMKNDFKDQGPVMLKNIQHPVHVWATSNINQTSSAMSSTDDDPKSKLVLVPIKVDPSISALQPACDRLIDSMFEVLSSKDWTKTLIDQNPRKNDYAINLRADPVAGKVQFSFNLLGPSGNVITSNKFNANPTGVDNIIDTLRDTVCSQILVSLMKFKKDF